MSKIWIITKRELTAYFDSLVAYMLIIIFLAITGYFTWLSDFNVFMGQEARLDTFFVWSVWTLFFFIPAITMRSLAEENRSGTIELLATKAITDWDVITGKFLASLLMVLVAIFCTLPYYFTVSSLGNIDQGAVTGGYLGLVLISSAYISIGIFASSITRNQIVAFILGLTIAFFFQFLFGLLGSSLTGAGGQILTYLSVLEHFDSIYRGVLDSRDLLFFISLSLLSLILAQSMIAKRTWKEE